MSDSDSFIDEVTEEVRRDRLFAMFRRYGWIAAVAIVAIVGGAAYKEYNAAQNRQAAEALGDSITTALQANDAAGRAAELSTVTAESPGGNAVVEFSLAAAQAEAGNTSSAVATLNAIAVNGEIPEIYRQIASFKALILQAGDESTIDERRTGLQALAQPGNPLRMLAEEQLALLSLEQDDTEAAIAKYQEILQDAETTSDLKQRATQAIVALGGKPEAVPGSQG